MRRELGLYDDKTYIILYYQFKKLSIMNSKCLATKFDIKCRPNECTTKYINDYKIISMMGIFLYSVTFYTECVFP